MVKLMKVIILAGGFGTRLSEYTDIIPKPMVDIGGYPMLWHIMNIYSKYNHKDFYIALGYKAQLIKEYFYNYHNLGRDFTINLGTGDFVTHKKDLIDWRVSLIDTGIDSMTGGRIKRLESHIDGETFMVTYGDGLANINIDELLKFHKKHGKMVTVTAVHPNARFGELDLIEDKVITFKEKPQTNQGWINGGYFVMEPEFLEFIAGDSSILEREPLERAASIGELVAYKHDGFWQCMDTKRDHDLLVSDWEAGKAEWI
jgi:glucose-1-phosphate cytidylyltransferase